ncbi:sulfatase [Variibacter gotjawalensis]|uniref:Sulfatase n=1 Tax=Variibacter gotjawalensis TaxID=1333996 RepID=A0A0S3PU34_9BRAD|nr:sulfatase-like hydrolase/transferase [Variibacter gotjawalensis]NIK49697.1 hypothetical protein [Variibacter gotjawalensis]RZS45709.1 phosphoglycerol transferase MdoB-like AlkP superfamily enzyme [Variibacter gotjawalensis]BAT59380.1 sulfatase [Variibacter gotjawalensis]
MPPAIQSLATRLGLAAAFRYDARVTTLILALHAFALGLMFTFELDLVSKLGFLFAWGVLNFTFLLVFRRPGLAAATSLTLIGVLILLSRLKKDTLFMTVNFVDVMIIDWDTLAFLYTIFPRLWLYSSIAALVAAPVLVMLWWYDPFRVRLRSALAGLALSVLGLVGLVWANPSDPYNEFYGNEYVSKFARSGVSAIHEYVTRGVFEADSHVVDRLKTPALAESCTPAGGLPHIVMIFDESSFDLSVAPNVKVPNDYQSHFKSFDGKSRKLVVEGINGPSWLTEYNVLTGLSTKSYGRFADFVTRIASGRVERGLPYNLRHCGYKTFSLYPFMGAFLSARNFQNTAGIENFLDSKALGAKGLEADAFYFNAATDIIAKERSSKSPLFMMVYTAANHFPWDFRFRPLLTPGWKALGNGSEVDEYLRRQQISRNDYADLKDRLKRNFPDEKFLIVRFGDHQPSIASPLMDPSLDETALSRRFAAGDPRFLKTYYAIDTINYKPADLSPALDTLDAAYLPLVVLEAAGVPLDPSFAEQKKILQRCGGVFYRCRNGAEASRFNRLLIDAGMIKGM